MRFPRWRTKNSLPISQVVLFSSGVGYFQREGAVTGKPVYLSRGGRLLRIAPVAARPKAKGAAARPFGYFTFDDDLTALANRAAPSFTPVDEN